MPDWQRYGYESYEAWIEAHAGDEPRSDWPMPKPPPYPADDEDQAAPDA